MRFLNLLVACIKSLADVKIDLFCTAFSYYCQRAKFFATTWPFYCNIAELILSIFSKWVYLAQR